MKKAVLLFGFDDLRTILAVKTAVERFGAELIPVGRGDYGKSLAVLAGLEDTNASSDTGGTWESALPMGPVVVLCGLDGDLDALLPALAKAGAGPGCLKAVLTPYNRAWNPAQLYGELSRERDALRARSAGKN